MRQRYLAILTVSSLMASFMPLSTPVSARSTNSFDSFLMHPVLSAQADTLVVDTEADPAPPLTACTPSANDCSLRGAILHVEQQLSGINVITLPMGRYRLSLDTAGNPNPLRIRSSLFLVGAGQETTIIDGENRSQILIVEGTNTPIVNIENVTFENGRGGSGIPGGAIRVNEGAYLGLYDSTVRNSGSNGPGGGIANGGDLQLTRSTLSHNKVPIVGTPMTGGTQHSGGGIMNFSGADLRIDSSTISYNEATRGGGIRNAGGHMEITNSTISSNTAYARGGGIMNFGTAFIAFSTITNNEANTLGLLCRVDGMQETERACGGGIFNDYNATTLGGISIGNSILAGNTDNRSRFQDGFSPDCFSPVLFSFTSFRGNLVGILTSNCNMRDTIWGDQRFDTAGTPESPVDPGLDVLRNNGGPTETHALLPGSPAMDTGTGATSATFFDCPPVDQRGVVRPQGAQCDIGAFEYQPEPIPPTITIVQDTQPDGRHNFRFTGDLGTFRLDDSQPDDSDQYSNSASFEVAAGTYTVQQVVPRRWYVTDLVCDSANSVISLDDARVTLTVADGEDVTCTFIDNRFSRIRVRKYRDENGNGRRNEGEPFLSGWQATLYDADGVKLDQQNTNKFGKAHFTQLRTGEYTVCETLRNRWFATQPRDVNFVFGQPCYTITIGPGEIAILWFGNTRQPPNPLLNPIEPDDGVLISPTIDENVDENDEGIDVDEALDVPNE